MLKTVFARFIIPMALASIVVAYVGLPYIDRLLAECFAPIWNCARNW